MIINGSIYIDRNILNTNNKFKKNLENNIKLMIVNIYYHFCSELKITRQLKKAPL